MKSGVYCYISRSVGPLPMLTLHFSASGWGNKWLKPLLGDTIYRKPKTIDETLAKNPDYLVNLAWELLNQLLIDLSEKGILDYLFANKMKIVVYLHSKTKFTQNQLFKLAKIIEEEELQDLIVIRAKGITPLRFCTPIYLKEFYTYKSSSTHTLHTLV